MIDERTLADPATCPSCGNPVVGVTTCPSCRADLAGATAARIWAVSVQAAQLLRERRRLLDQLRGEVREPAAVRGAGVPLRTSTPPPSRSAAGRTAPAPEWTRRRVQNLLLSLGVGLLAVAAVIFLVVSWSVLGLGGRAAVMVGCTLLAGAGAGLAHRKGLDATAEAVSLLSVGLALLDGWGARHAGLGGFDRADGLAYWAGALAVVAALAAASAVVVPTRGLRVPAALLAQLPVPLLAIYLSDRAEAQLAVLAAGMLLAAVLALGVAAAWPFGSATRDARLTVAVGGAVAWLVAVGAGLATAYSPSGSVAAGSMLLLGLAVLAGAAVAVVRPVAMPASAVSALLVVAAVWAPVVDGVGERWRPVALAAVVLPLLAAAVLVPLAVRRPPVAALLACLAGPGVVALHPLALVAAGHLGWLDRAWTVDASDSARVRLATLVDAVREPARWGAEVPVLLIVLVAGLGVLVVVHRSLLDGLGRAALAVAGPIVMAAAFVAPAAADLSYRAAMLTDVTVGGLALLAGVEVWRRGGRLVGGSLLGAGVVLLGLATAWSFAAEPVTLTVLPVVALLLSGAAGRSPGTGAVALPRLPLAVVASLVALTEVGALARSAGAGWAAVASAVLSVAAVLATGAAVLVPGVVRRGLVVTATVALLADLATVTLWSGGSAADAGLVLAAGGGLGAATVIWLRQWWSGTPRAAELGLLGDDVVPVAVLGAAAGVVLSGLDADRLWLALLATGACAAVVGLRPGLHRVGWLAGGLLTASSWVRLVLSDVDAPEPYTVPAGVALVAIGLLRRRRDPTYPSWRADATGLLLALGPSLVRAVTDAGTVRPVLLGVAALVVLVAGIGRRLQAPLVIGGSVLAVDALVQLSPSLLALYDAVPRWTLLAVAGLLLLGVGATYEQRAREVRALRHHVSRFG